MDLEENMYLRTFGGIIIKLEDLEFDICFRIDMGINKPFWRNGNFNNQIKKASHSLIDLIEVGDYVNGYKVTKVNKDRFFTNEQDYYAGGWGNKIYGKDFKTDIKSIVTKEQFKSIEYTVKE